MGKIEDKILKYVSFTARTKHTIDPQKLGLFKIVDNQTSQVVDIKKIIEDISNDYVCGGRKYAGQFKRIVLSFDMEYFNRLKQQKTEIRERK